MVSTTLICVSHPCRLILSSWHILSCLMDDNPYLVDTFLVVASSCCWLLDILDVSQRPLYIGTPSVLYIMLNHTASWHTEYIVILIIFGLLCLCVNSWFLGEFSLRQILTWYQSKDSFSSRVVRPPCFITSARIERICRKSRASRPRLWCWVNFPLDKFLQNPLYKSLQDQLAQQDTTYTCWRISMGGVHHTEV